MYIRPSFASDVWGQGNFGPRPMNGVLLVIVPCDRVRDVYNAVRPCIF